MLNIFLFLSNFKLCFHLGRSLLFVLRVIWQFYDTLCNMISSLFYLQQEEWQLAKQVVKAQQYPRDNTSRLWQLIAEFHREQFPGLTQLGALALLHPIHTADCERSFSYQNRVTKPIRNRLSPEHCDQLMNIMINGPDIKDFDFEEALDDWRKSKNRVLLK